MQYKANILSGFFFVKLIHKILDILFNRLEIQVNMKFVDKIDMNKKMELLFIWLILVQFVCNYVFLNTVVNQIFDALFSRRSSP